MSCCDLNRTADNLPLTSKESCDRIQLDTGPLERVLIPKSLCHNKLHTLRAFNIKMLRL